MESTNAKEQACDEVGRALNEGSMGDIVAKHEKLILKYYEDVQEQAKRSFNTARSTAKIGFGVLFFTLLYIFLFDALRRFKIADNMSEASLTISAMGIISGALIEFIAGVSFLLYSRSARQFSAFHICLERTHRYLLAYKIAEKMEIGKDDTLRDLVCIMASAPMITLEPISKLLTGLDQL